MDTADAHCVQFRPIRMQVEKLRHDRAHITTALSLHVTCSTLFVPLYYETGDGRRRASGHERNRCFSCLKEIHMGDMQ
ncbi:hypothetical protein CFB84_30090 [Burkholderia aenigmatica]|uniref:Uncharacterized protein n=1 Tax=Burkholderia aenigmatica TaxID=2015348 RepID=A0A228I438_9BURK|nr:hypothetical protein CFB84_30090 [Burkholderia aenigmatica]